MSARFTVGRWKMRGRCARYRLRPDCTNSNTAAVTSVARCAVGEAPEFRAFLGIGSARRRRWRIVCDNLNTHLSESVERLVARS